MRSGTGWTTMKTTMLTSLLTALASAVHGQDPPELRIELEHGSEAERSTAQAVRALVAEYDVRPWILTRDILIDETSIPHSHPVLTIHTRHVDDGPHLLATFVHEQLHWLEEGPWLSDFRTAMAAYEELFPDVPSSDQGGARDRTSTYRHLLVCDMEYQAMTTLVGNARARETLARITHYEWIYDRVLNDPRVREVAVRHGFDVRDGVPER